MAEYVYTLKAERRAAEKGLKPRKAGSPAYFAGKPLKGGITAQDWLRKGYIVKKEEYEDER